LIYKFEIWNELLLLRSFVNRFAHFCAFLHLGMQDIQLSGFFIFIISTVNIKNQIILKKKKELTSWCNKLTDAVVDNLSWPTSIRTFFFSGIFCPYLWEREREREIKHINCYMSIQYQFPGKIVSDILKKKKNRTENVRLPSNLMRSWEHSYVLTLWFRL
jgi:hypothetical protein